MKININSAKCFGFLLLTALILQCHFLLAQGNKKKILTSESITRIEVSKAERKLVAYNPEGEVRYTYSIRLGGEPIGPKQCQGDSKTPEGSYTLDYRNPKSSFYKSFHITYPNVADRANSKKLGCPTGGDIMLHGTGRYYRASHNEGTDWTDGCVAVTDAEIDTLWKYVSLPAQIVIKP